MNFSPDFLNALPTYPLTELREDFFRAIDLHADSQKNTLLLEAEPGAGKSTLAPLWVLAKLLNLSSDKKIILVQPRVLAAQSLAQRLAELIGEPLGQTVGYQVPYESCT